MSGATIAESLSKEKYDVKTVGITKEGAWFLYEGPAEGQCAAGNGCATRRAAVRYWRRTRPVHGLLVEGPARPP